METSTLAGDDPINAGIVTSPDFDPDQFPPLDLDYLSNNLMFDDDPNFDFSFDNLSFPIEDEGFTLDGSEGLSSNVSDAGQNSGDGSSGDVDGFLNCPTPESGGCDRGVLVPASSQDSGGSRSGVVVDGLMNSGSPDTVVNLECLNSQSPDSGVNSSSGSPVFARSDPLVILDVEQKVKLDLKRKKEREEESNSENASRICKFRRAIQSESENSMPDEEDKRKARLMRNRESAQLSRQRKKHYVEELEDKVRSMHAMIADLNGKVSYFMAENASLRQQLSSGAVYPPPPMASMPYPWFPYSYPMKPQGSQVPLVPIPKLKPQKPIPATSKPSSKSESKKSQSKTKKVASVSFLGLLFFLVLFGGLVPLVNNRYGEKMEVGSGEFGSSFSNVGSSRWSQGRVLTVNGSYQGGEHSRRHCTDGIHCERGYGKGAESEHSSKVKSDGFVLAGNASEPLVASLYVPRNDKLVKIDGNLIINSVLASEKAMTRSSRSSGTKNDKAPISSSSRATGTGLVVAGDLRPSIAVSNDRNSHSYGSDRTGTNDGSLQKWFREGMEGPILSSGMCTEVFQFEISPTSSNSGAIIPVASSMHNVSVNGTKSSADPSKRRNRRILGHLPIPLSGLDLNATGQHDGKASHDPNSNRKGTVSPPMVVSVMFDPREAGDGESDGMISPKSLSRIFVVVLLDSVKYVTYSCMLPFKTSSPHLVAN